MAIAARKDEYIYAPSRVYSHSRAAVAEALPENAQEEVPRPAQPELKTVPQRTRQPAVKTRIHRGVSVRQRRKQRTLPRVLSVGCVFIMAAILIGVIMRYSMITLAYSNINDLEDQIAESERNIAALNVQLNSAIDLNAARETALAAGLGYPTAEQIVTVRETVGSYQKDDGGADGELDQKQDEGADPAGSLDTD